MFVSCGHPACEQVGGARRVSLRVNADYLFERRFPTCFGRRFNRYPSCESDAREEAAARVLLPLRCYVSEAADRAIVSASPSASERSFASCS